MPFVNGQASGTPVVVDSSINWASDGAFVVSAANINDKPPVAAFSATNCQQAGVACGFDATASTDADGVIASYSWNFGDGTTVQDTTGQEQHTYSADGAYPVTMTATDNDGVSTSVSHTVYIGVSPPAAISFAGVSTKYGNATSETVSIPAAASAGDALLLFDTYASATTTASAPPGWTLVGTSVKGSYTTAVYSDVAGPSDAGTPLTVTYSATVKATLTVAAYANTDGVQPVEASAFATAAASSSDTAPGLTGLTDGSFVVSYWADKSSATTSFTAPAAVTTRALTLGAGAGAVNGLLGDSGGSVFGSYGPQTATTNDASSASSSWTIALSQATS